VREILWVSSDGPRVQVLLPETTLTLVLRQSGQVLLRQESLASALVSGLQRRARVVEHGAGSSLVIVRFTEVGAAAVLRDRVDLMYDRTLALDSVLPRGEIERVQNILADSPGRREQVAAVESFLRSRIREQDEIGDGVSRQIEAAVQMIRNSDGRCSIAAIARHAAMSQSSLERHFRAFVGATPKGLARLARLQHVCRLWGTGKSLTTISAEAGYFDQPHMVRDFRLFTDRSPEEFFRGDLPRNLPTFYK
jgi:AraC-like DNA-binding protein